MNDESSESNSNFSYSKINKNLDYYNSDYKSKTFYIQIF